MTDKKATPNQILDSLELAAAYMIANPGKVGTGVSLKTAAFQTRYRDDPIGFMHDCIIWEDGAGPTSYQEEIAQAIVDHDRVSARMTRGGGKCVGSNEDILLYDGTYKKASELIGHYFVVPSIDRYGVPVGAIGYAESNGIKKTLKIITRYGRQLIRTENHPLLTGDGWRRVDELMVGDKVAFPLQTPVEGKINLSYTDLKLLAYFIGDGSVTGGITFSQEEGSILDEWMGLVNSYGCIAKQISKYDYRVAVEGNSEKRISDRTQNPIKELLIHHEVYGKTAYTKRVPKEIFNCDNEHIAVFLSRLFATDGWAYGRSNHGSMEIGYCSVSRELCVDIQRLLLRLGIVGTVCKRKTTWTYGGEQKTSWAWQWIIRGSEMILKFINTVGIFGKDEAVRICRERAIKQLASNNPSKPSYKKSPPITDEFVSRIENLGWDEIIDIEDIGDMETVAICVPQTNIYIGDLIEHNTFLLAILTLWFALTRDGEDWKVATTAGSYRQLERALWPEIHLWARHLRWEKIGREPFDERYGLMALSLKLRTGFAFAGASSKAYLMESTHAKHLLYIYDEAKAIPDATFDAIEGSFSNQKNKGGFEGKSLVFSTPGEPNGRFWDIHSGKEGLNYWVRHVKVEEAIAAGQVSEEWVRDQRKFYGEESTYYKQQVLAEFATNDKDSVIPLDWIEKAMGRWDDWDDNGRNGKFVGLGVDVGRGGDTTVIAAKFGEAVSELRYLPKTDDTMMATGKVLGLMDYYAAEDEEDTSDKNDSSETSIWSQPIAVVDVNGIGAGMVDRLRELGRNVLPFNASSRSTLRDESWSLGFVNKRAEYWWKMREALDPKNGSKLALPRDPRLLGDLTAPKYRVLTGPVGKIQIESKDEIRRRINRSTDAADAVIQIVVGSGSGAEKYIAILENETYDCPQCGEPVFDFGDKKLICQRCGKEIDRTDGVREDVEDQDQGVDTW